MLEELERNPASARELQVGAIVMKADSSSEKLQRIWAGLQKNGVEWRLGEDRVLVSPCYFAGTCAVTRAASPPMP